jgi:hypothetical protein
VFTGEYDVCPRRRRTRLSHCSLPQSAGAPVLILSKRLRRVPPHFATIKTNISATRAGFSSASISTVFLVLTRRRPGPLPSTDSN